MPLDQTHLSLIMDLVANDEMNVEAATKAIARLAEHARVIDSSDEARFRALYSEQAHGQYVSNYHLPWTPQDVQTLKKMRRSGAEFDAIARRLKRTIRGVRSRWAFELMLEREASRNATTSETDNYPPPYLGRRKMKCLTNSYKRVRLTGQ